MRDDRHSHSNKNPTTTQGDPGRAHAATLQLLPPKVRRPSKLTDEKDLLLSVWSQTLDALASDPETLAGKVDWITKRWLFRQFREQEKIPWSHPWLKSQDLEFHHIDPARGLGAALAQNPPGWELPRKEVTQAAFLAPANTRAAVRSRAMRLLKDEKRGYYIDWESVGADGGNAIQMLNPFDAGCPDTENWLPAPADSAARTPSRWPPPRPAPALARCLRHLIVSRCLNLPIRFGTGVDLLEQLPHARRRLVHRFGDARAHAAVVISHPELRQ